MVYCLFVPIFKASVGATWRTIEDFRGCLLLLTFVWSEMRYWENPSTAFCVVHAKRTVGVAAFEDINTMVLIDPSCNTDQGTQVSCLLLTKEQGENQRKVALFIEKGFSFYLNP